MQVCMDSSDWLKGIVHEEMGMDSSSPSTELISCSRPPSGLERRLRPQHDQAIQCPRCDSTHTKFCYYNNYSLSQPRYFCKTCRRYWTKGGSLRNVPVGGGCRKNKRSSNKKPMMDRSLINPQQPNISCFHNETDLHLSFPGMHLPHHETIPEGFAECKYHLNGLDLMESSRSHFLMGEMGLGDSNPSDFHGLNQLGFQGNHGTLMEACQRLSIPFEDPNSTEVKSVDRMLLPIEWQELGCAEVGRGDSFGYSGGFGMWTGMINGKHGPSAAI